MTNIAERRASVARGGRIVDLGQMDLGDLVRAYVTYPSMILYAVLVVAALAGAFWLGALDRPWRSAAVVGLTLVIYPPVEYLLHRFVLHARWLYKNPLTATLWKRIHYRPPPGPAAAGRAVRLAVQHPSGDRHLHPAAGPAGERLERASARRSRRGF